MEGKNQLDVNPLEFFSKVCNDIRQNMSDQVQLKSTSTEADEDQMSQLRLQGSFSFLTLKQLNRLSQIRCKNIKDATSEAKQKLDGYYLTLQNLQYEISHLHREITKCLEFRSRHDSIPLVDVEEFYADAPPDISKPGLTQHDEHAQTLARLDWELEQRKRLSSTVSELEKKKEQALSQIDKKKQDFNMLVPCLDNLLKASLPLQQAFDLPLEKAQSEEELANLLPRPLFVLFLQAKAYQEACDTTIEVSISGDKVAAAKLQQLHDRRSLVATVSNQSDDESESDQEEPEDSERARKKHKKSKKAKMETNELKIDENSKLHPLQISICLNDLYEGSKLELKFFYYIKLEFVSVKANLNVAPAFKNDLMLESSNLLTCMMNDDDGQESPNPAANHLAPKWNVASMVNIAGYPYMWAQRMCGLNFIGPKQNAGEDMKMSFKHVGNSFSRIKSRVTSRIMLKKQLLKLEQNVKRSLATSANATTLEKWEQLSCADYRKMPRNKAVVELGLSGGNSLSRNLMYFEAFFTKNLPITTEEGRQKSVVTLKVAVALFADYPVRLPLLTCQVDFVVNDVTVMEKISANDYNIRAMEEIVNISLPEIVVDKNQVLLAQLKKMSELFDVYVDTSIHEGEVDLGTISTTISKSLVSSVRHHGPARVKSFDLVLH